MKRILVAEDEPRIATFIERGLQANGFTTAVAKNGCEAVRMADSKHFDLLLLDIGLPDQSGWTVLAELRGRGEQLPIIILTAYDDLNDKVTGLENGADDYMTKPFHLQELLARIRLRLRPNTLPKGKEEMLLIAGNIMLNLYSRQVQVGDRLLDLSAREFIMLETFLRHPGQVLSREQLLDSVWGYDYEPGTNIVNVYVGYLRKKLGEEAIVTIRGMGYRLQT